MRQTFFFSNTYFDQTNTINVWLHRKKFISGETAADIISFGTTTISCCDNNGQLLIGKTDDFKLPGYCRLLSAKSCLTYIMKPERPEPNWLQRDWYNVTVTEKLSVITGAQILPRNFVFGSDHTRRSPISLLTFLLRIYLSQSSSLRCHCGHSYCEQNRTSQ